MAEEDRDEGSEGAAPAGSPSPDGPGDGRPKDRLFEVKFDETSVKRGSSNIEHEREVAIYDLIEANQFALDGRDEGPYRLTLGISDDRLVFAIGTNGADVIQTHVLSLSPLRRVVRDYFLVCDTYYEAIRSAPPSRIQAIDMGRRALHDEGSRLLVERLSGKVRVDHDTARRLFTLICALHWKG